MITRIERVGAGWTGYLPEDVLVVGRTDNLKAESFLTAGTRQRLNGTEGWCISKSVRCARMTNVDGRL